jgi:hypothetical protein
MESRALSITDWKSVAGWLLQEETDEGVSHVLRLFGTRHASDRAWVIRYDDAFTHLWNTHEWVAPGIAPMVHDIQGIPVEAGLWIHEALERDGRVMIEDVNRMPRRARGLQAEFQRQGILSLLALPVFRNGKLAFQIGYDSVRRHRSWKDEEVAELAEASELIGRALWSRGGAGRSPFPAFTPEARLIHLRVGVGSVAIPMAEIQWIEADGDYTIVHTKGNRRNTERRSVREWESILPKEEFIRIHRGVIVRVDAITRLDRSGGQWQLMLGPEAQALSVGRAYRPVLRIHLGF